MIQLPRSLIRSGWSWWHVIGAFVAALLGVVATFDAWRDIFEIARKDPEYSHIFLVLPVVAWLVWVRRRRLRLSRPGPSWLGPIMAMCGWALMSYGFFHAASFWAPIMRGLISAGIWLVDLIGLEGLALSLRHQLIDSQVQVFMHAGAVIAVIGCFIAVAGRDVLFRFMPAFLVLVFLVPIPGYLRVKIALPLQQGTAAITEWVLLALGADVQRSVNSLKVNGQEVTVAEACNGLRMVFALFLVSYAFAYSSLLREYVRVLIVAASPLTAMLCNVIRLIPTAWVFGWMTKDMADLFHKIGGWVMLVVGLFMLMGIIRVLRWAMLPITRYSLAYENG
ncbi:MAG: hypothetical protein CMJ49_00585 [Planctomycetaceae bacterium]|nr:hypothetical protein [Planctomycetaceae bacterium]